MRFFLFILIVFIISCRGERSDQPEEMQILDKQLTDMNKKIIGDESIQIDDFAARHFLKLQKTGTGLRYQITKTGTGDHPELHQIVVFNSSVYFLDGTLIYKNDPTKPDRIKLGEGNQTNGFEEGIMLMKSGGEANLVVPSHLGYGTSGDGKNIPPLTPLYYKIELIKIVK